MWCSNCKSVTICAAIPILKSEILGKSQRKLDTRTSKGNLRWFERRRRCLQCKHEFNTVEIDEDRLYELMRLRDAIEGIHKRAEAMLKWQQ
jgi:hypothetical protein